jgi:hypothetical protein
VGRAIGEITYQFFFIITILIFRYLIDKKSVVPQLLGSKRMEGNSKRGAFMITAMAYRNFIRTSFLLASAALLLAIMLDAPRPRADEIVTSSLTIKDHELDPAEVHAPAGKPIAFRVKNLGTIAAEFESSALHFERIVAVGGEIVVHVRPLEPGRYNFFDDFHRDTQGFLVVQ